MSIDPDLPEDDLSSAVGAETLLAHDLVQIWLRNTLVDTYCPYSKAS
jgi:hypothetical protein